MKPILQKIANILFIQTQTINQIEVLNGITGITVFFYHYAKFSKIEEYHSFADYLLDYMIENIDQMNLWNLVNFSWGIEYMIQQEFIEGDSNEILEEVDKKIIVYSKQSEAVDDSVVFWGLYFLSRIKKENRSNQKNCRYCKIILKKIEKKLHTQKEFTLSYLNSMLYSLLEIHAMNLFEFDRDQMIENQFFTPIFYSLSNNRYDQNDLKTLLHFLDKYNLPQKEKLVSLLSQKNDLSSQNTIEYVIKNEWQNLLFFKEEKQEGFDRQLAENFLDSIVRDISVDNLTINKGIAGLGMALLKTGI
jgi:hypothetical protein